jgi:hypothetical protein
MQVCGWVKTGNGKDFAAEDFTFPPFAKDAKDGALRDLIVV